MAGHLADGSLVADSAQRLAAVRRYAILDVPPDGAFDRVCALAARFFGAPFASVTIVDEDQIWIKASQGLDAPHIPRSAGLCASAILQDEPYVVTDGLTDPRTAGNPLVHGDLGVRFYAAAQIVTRDGHRLGTVNVLDTKPREATAEEMQTLRDLAAIVMDELELRLAAIHEIQREQDRREGAEHLARTLQRSLSPSSLPRIAGLDTAVHYEPYAAAEIGGDFYDVYPLAPTRSGFFLGDVCGKGAAAAAVTSLARYTMRAAAMLNEGPAAILAGLNAALLIEGAVSMETCTVVCGEIDISNGTGSSITIAAAGHPPPLIVRADGSVETTTASGTILGAVEHPVFCTYANSLEPGDAVVIFSDGILDTEIDGVTVDQQRITQLLAGAASATAQDLVNRISRALPTMTNRRDDVAIMALRQTPVG